MSKLYASIKGERGEATRQGHHVISGHIRGWDAGVKVNGAFLGSDTEPTFAIYLTGGSNSSRVDKFIGSITMVNGVPTFTAKEG